MTRTRQSLQKKYRYILSSALAVGIFILLAIQAFVEWGVTFGMFLIFVLLCFAGGCLTLRMLFKEYMEKDFFYDKKVMMYFLVRVGYRPHLWPEMIDGYIELKKLHILASFVYVLHSIFKIAAYILRYTNKTAILSLYNNIRSYTIHTTRTYQIKYFGRKPARG